MYQPSHFRGFTLVEILIVVSIMAMLFVVAVRGFASSQQNFLFTNVSQQFISMVREARTLAINGKAQLDFTDYDQDGLNANSQPKDFVTPAHYGIHFNVQNNKILLFADIHTDKLTGYPVEGQFDMPGPQTQIGHYEAGKDVVLQEYQLDSAYALQLIGNTQNIFYSPVLADTSFDSTFNGSILNFGIKEVKGSRAKCFSIHVVSGAPEEVAPAECQ